MWNLVYVVKQGHPIKQLRCCCLSGSKNWMNVSILLVRGHVCAIKGRTGLSWNVRVKMSFRGFVAESKHFLTAPSMFCIVIALFFSNEQPTFYIRNAGKMQKYILWNITLFISLFYTLSVLLFGAFSEKTKSSFDFFFYIFFWWCCHVFLKADLHNRLTW